MDGVDWTSALRQQLRPIPSLVPITTTKCQQMAHQHHPLDRQQMHSLPKALSIFFGSWRNIISNEKKKRKQWRNSQQLALCCWVLSLPSKARGQNHKNHCRIGWQTQSPWTKRNDCATLHLHFVRSQWPRLLLVWTQGNRTIRRMEEYSNRIKPTRLCHHFNGWIRRRRREYSTGLVLVMAGRQTCRKHVCIMHGQQMSFNLAPRCSPGSIEYAHPSHSFNREHPSHRDMNLIALAPSTGYVAQQPSRVGRALQIASSLAGHRTNYYTQNVVHVIRTKQRRSSMRRADTAKWCAPWWWMVRGWWIEPKPVDTSATETDNSDKP